MFCKRIFLIVLFTGNLFGNSFYEKNSLLDDLAGSSRDKPIYITPADVKNLPGSSWHKPIYTAPADIRNIPGGSQWQPLYTTEAEPGLMRTLGKEFVKVIQDS